jgi:hypothetical protein
MHAILVGSKFIEMILAGKKAGEIRGRRANMKEGIALIPNASRPVDDIGDLVQLAVLRTKNLWITCRPPSEEIGDKCSNSF